MIHSKGVELIGTERVRQITREGWSAEHDATHRGSEIAEAAADLLAAYMYGRRNGRPSTNAGRWGLVRKHGHDSIRSLTIAGALVAAEIDRLLNVAPTEDEIRAALDATRTTTTEATP